MGQKHARLNFPGNTQGLPKLMGGNTWTMYSLDFMLLILFPLFTLLI